MAMLVDMRRRAQRGARPITRGVVELDVPITLQERGLLHVLEQLTADAPGGVLQERQSELARMIRTTVRSLQRHLTGLDDAGLIRRERTGADGARITLTYPSD